MGMNSLLELAGRCERSAVPDRVLDFWIYVRMNPGKDSDEALQADIDMIGIEGMHNPIPYTSSIDAAASLVPEDWFWQVGRTSHFYGWAKVYETHPDHGEEHKNEFYSNCEYWRARLIPPISCLLACALRARASDAYRRQLSRKQLTAYQRPEGQ